MFDALPQLARLRNQILDLCLNVFLRRKRNDCRHEVIGAEIDAILGTA